MRSHRRSKQSTYLAAFCASVKNNEIGLKDGGISNERNESNSVSMMEAGDAVNGWLKERSVG
jgi:hypothetical protein